MGFHLAILRVTMRAKQAVRLPPFKGSLLRGALGHALKRLSPQVYTYFFETPIPPALTPFHLDQAPHPFILEPPLDEKTDYAPDDVFSFHLILLGNAISYLPYLIVALDGAGRSGLGTERGRFNLERMESVPHSDAKEGKPVLIGKEFIDEPEIKTKADMEAEAEKWEGQEWLRLVFLTPVRLQRHGKLTDRLDPETLMRNLLRRYSLLSQLHCGERLEEDFKGLVQEAKRSLKVVEHQLVWRDYQRYSQRQRQTLKLGGVIGTLTLFGELSPYRFFLKAGEYLHIGKQTTFGLGKYLVVSIPSFQSPITGHGF